MLAILPALTLFAAGCSTLSQPSVTQAGPQGNSYRLGLPVGTAIILPSDATATQVRAVAVNELDPAQSVGRSVVLAKPLQLVSPAYIAERNLQEVKLLQYITDLKTENARQADK